MKAVRQISMFRLSAFHIPKTKTLRAVMLVAVVLSAGSLFAEGKVFWHEGGVVVCDRTWHAEQAAVSDDSGGVFVVWCDTRGVNGSVWAQHVDRDGNTVWQRNGVFVGDGDARDVNQLSAISDGRGGLIAAWHRGSDYSPYGRHEVTAQRLDATGTVLWDSGGVVVAGADSGFRYAVATVSDGRGGAILAWKVVAGDSTGVDSLVAQRIDSLGNLCWGNPGLVLATDSVATWHSPYMCADGIGGACITWNSSGSYMQTVAQHIDSSGCATWPGGGVLLFTPDRSPIDIMRLSGGYEIASARSYDIRAQRIDDQGQLLWGPDGSNVYYGTSDGVIMFVRILPGPGSSSFVMWTEERDDTTDVYAQFVDGAGERYWDSLGIDVGTTNEDQDWYFGCVAGSKDGFIVSWPRNSGGPTRFDIYAQNLDTAGRLLWGNPGLGIATDTVSQWHTPCVVPDARQGAIITWGCAPGMLRAQRVGDVSGVAGAGTVSFARSTIQAHPSPARGGSALQWPAGLGRSVAIFDASGRRVTTLLGFVSPEGDMRADWNARDDQGRRVPPGVYVCTLGAGAEALTQKIVLTR
jgi:hypothetical protein